MSGEITSKNPYQRIFAVTDFPITVLLVDNQLLVAEAIRFMLKDQPDIAFYSCEDPSNIVQRITEVHPTVILQDLAIPNMDGLQLVRFLRENPITADIPLIVLSSQEDPLVKANALELGANDFMIKLPDRIELIARIRYHSLAYIRLLDRNYAHKKLEESQRILNAELAEAAAYVKSLLPKPLEGKVKTSWHFLPSTQLGGDAFGYQWINRNDFIFFLLDVCGHGIGAALLSISIMNVLRSQTMFPADFLEPESMLATLNDNFLMEQHNDMFFTIWYGAYNLTTRLLTYSSGGHPPAILVHSKPTGMKKLTELRTDGPAIGATPKAHFRSASCEVPKGSRLYLFSDGIYEIAKPDGSVLQLEEFIKEIGMPSKKGVEEIDRILGFSRSLMHEKSFADDVSLLEIVFN